MEVQQTAWQVSELRTVTYAAQGQTGVSQVNDAENYIHGYEQISINDNNIL